MYKIYSRRRFLLKPHFRKIFPNLPYKKIHKSKTLKILTIIMTIILICKLILNYVEPVFESMCEEKAKSMATIITNQQSTIVMNEYQYEQLYSIEKDDNGNIVIIKANIVPLNNMMSDLAEKVQNEFNKLEKTTIEIPVGSLTGSYMFSGIGPNIPIQVAIMGNIDTEVKSEFIEQGINQTLHRLYVILTCKMKILTPIKNFEREITNQVIIAEHVILGDIPDSYYNLEGMNNTQDTLNVID